jgi:hypothetical protein
MVIPGVVIMSAEACARGACARLAGVECAPNNRVATNRVATTASIVASTAVAAWKGGFQTMKNSMMVVVCSLVMVSSDVWAGPAERGAPVCELVEAGFVELDGMLDDWSGIKLVRVGGPNRNGSFSLRCAYDHDRLYVAVDVRDQDVVRQPGKAGAEDRLTLALSATGGAEAVLEVFPGVDGIDPRRRWKGKALGASDAVTVEDTLQEHGWSMEVAVPLRQIAGLGKGAPGVRARVSYRDPDRRGKGSPAQFEGTLVFRAGAEAFKGFLGAVKLAPGSIRLDATADFDGTPGVERVVAGGLALGIITDGFAYMTLPVTAPGDVRRVEAVDLRGDGTMSIVTELRQHGNGGSRDLLVVWGLASHDRFERVLAVEVRKELAGKKMRNRWSLAPRAGGRGQDIVIEVGPDDAVGWNANNYLEAPAADVHVILKPWGEQTRARFSFEGNVAVAVDADEPPARKSGGKRRR